MDPTIFILHEKVFLHTIFFLFRLSNLHYHVLIIDSAYQPSSTTTTTATLQRPYLLQGHERPITVVKYNYDGDLLFSASKDQVPSVWRSENGERLGTFNGHKGTIWDLDCDRFTIHLLTASADA